MNPKAGQQVAAFIIVMAIVFLIFLTISAVLG